MANAWLHATMDLIAFGKPYFALHQQKDEAYETLGPEHRKVNHEWYNKFGNQWTFSDPFPIRLKQFIQAVGDAKGDVRAEEWMVWATHDYIDRVCDRLSDAERKYWESFFIWLLFNPQILRDWAGVDVVEGRIHRVIDDQEIWEDCPEIIGEYEKLCRYVMAVVNKDETLQGMLRFYGLNHR